MPELRVTAGPDTGRTFHLTCSGMLGRESSCVYRLSDLEVSRQHVELRQEADGGFSAFDRGSSNGLLVNGERTLETRLRSGDRLRIGTSTLVFIDAGAIAWSEAGLDLETAIVHRAPASRSSKSLDALYEVIHAAGSIPDLDSMLKTALEIIARAVHADRGCIFLRDGDSLTLRARFGAEGEWTVSRGIVRHVEQRREGIIVADTTADARFAQAASVIEAGARAVLAVPLLGRHGDIGALYLDTRAGRAEQFGPEQLALAVAVAHQIAAAVEQTKYFEALVRSERLAAVGQTVAALSHHIKNILQGLQTSGELLQQGWDSDDPSAQQAGRRLFERYRRRVFDLVQDMLAFSTPREPVRRPCNLGEIVRDVVEFLRPTTEQHGIAVACDADAHLNLHLDEEGIHRAVMNLVSNAIDAVAEREQPAIWIIVRADGDEAIVRVVDNGPGIESDRRHTIFQPFVTSKGGRGTGLGLAVSRKIVEEHGGTLTVESTVGVGSTFTLRIPMQPPAPLAEPA